MKEFCNEIYNQQNETQFSGKIDWNSIISKLSDILPNFTQEMCEMLWRFLAYGVNISSTEFKDSLQPGQVIE